MGARHFCPKLCMKINKMLEFYTIFARKINKFSECYTTFARKMPEYYIMFAGKYFPGFFFFGEGGNPPLSYAYGWAPGFAPAKSGPAPYCRSLSRIQLQYTGFGNFTGDEKNLPKCSNFRLFLSSYITMCTITFYVSL